MSNKDWKPKFEALLGRKSMTELADMENEYVTNYANAARRGEYNRTRQILDKVEMVKNEIKKRDGWNA